MRHPVATFSSHETDSRARRYRVGASKSPDRTTLRPDFVTNEKNDGKLGPPDAAGMIHPADSAAEGEEGEAEGASRVAAAGAPSALSIAGRQ